MIVSMIVAMSENRVIGKDGGLPWHLPEDLKRFKKITMGHPIIMGRKTYESIGRALPGRRNIVISRNSNLQIDGVETTSSLGEALDLVKSEKEVFIIGGAQIYEASLSQADRIYLTEVHQQIHGDAYFPEINSSQFQEVSRESHGEAGYDYVLLEKNA